MTHHQRRFGPFQLTAKETGSICIQMRNHIQKNVFAAALTIAGLMGHTAWAECGDLCDIFWWKWADTSDVQDLLDIGFDVNGQSKSGYRPLHWAGWIGAPDTMQVLLEAGADISARDIRGDTALHVAAWAGSPENVVFLMNAGANARAKNYDGKTPWDLAQDNDNLYRTEAYWTLNAAQ